MRITWPDLTFPPINLWSFPMNYTLFSRYCDMYCAAELETYYKYKSITDLRKLNLAQTEFKGIWAIRHEYWELIN